MTRNPRPIAPAVRLSWIAWYVVWAGFALPWAEAGMTPHWERVQWIPFQMVRPRDVVLNLLFFVPFGALGVLSAWRVASVLLAAAAVAGFTEAVQVFAPDRWPSATDLLLNLAGTLTGLAAARSALRRS